ncbi:ABC transporter ATP-binding protein [Aestuariimicrobium sp. Y1814]|uniref:ABC transporter ATP-binding protein n=1 Tax=Aestuariimicrobium sp. Y1814 TaxID=3418742 RepID=UPI003DA7A5BB
MTAGTTPTLRVAATVAVRNVQLDVDLDQGRTLAVVGPNGSGKSTLLQLVAGLVRPDEGSVEIAGRTVSGPGTMVEVHKRGVGLLTQRSLLFDHLSVLDNVAFGVRAQGTPKKEAAERAMVELGAVGLADLAGRRPRHLSGGQAQRVALARALATDPSVVMLDEPLAALDVDAALHMRALLAQRLRGRTALLVTHDPLDLWTLADDVLVIEAGRVRQRGSLDEVAQRPATGFLAGLLGTNRLLGVASSPEVVRVGDLEVVGVASEADPPRDGSAAMALFDPSAVVLHPADDKPQGSARNVWPVEVIGVEPRGALVRVRTQLDDGQLVAADVTARSVAELGIGTVADGVAGSSGGSVRLLAAVKAAQVSCVADAHRAEAGDGAA